VLYNYNCQLIMNTVHIFFKDEEFSIDTPVSATVGGLKEQIQCEIGWESETHDLYYCGIHLDDNLSIGNLLRDGIGSSFNLIVHPAQVEKDTRAFKAYKEMFLICGGRRNFEPIQLKPEKQELKKLKSSRFGISDNYLGDVGSRIFHVRIYETTNPGSIMIEGENDGNDYKVYLKTDKDDLQEIEPNDTKTFYETERLETVTTILKFLKPIGRIVGGVGGLVSGVGTLAELATVNSN